MFLLLMGVVLTAVYGSDACLYNTDCDINQFCSEKTACYDCFNCTEYGRESPNLDCVKNVEQCGICLPGFSFVQNHIELRKSRYCIAFNKSSTDFSEEIDMMNKDDGMKLIIGILSGGFVFIIVVVILFWQFVQKPKARAQKKLHHYQSRTLENPPPYNESFRPTAPNVTVNVPEEETPRCIYIAETQGVKAVAFQPPVYVKAPAVEENDEENDTEVSNFMGDTEDFLMDDSTQDSNWTPNTNPNPTVYQETDDNCVDTVRPFKSIATPQL